METVNLPTAAGRHVVAAAVVAAAALAGAGCAEGGQNLPGSASAAASSRVPAHGPELVARPLSPFGNVLTTGSGYALYVFEPDAGKRVTCTGECASRWPPLRPTGPLSRIAGSGVRRSLLGLDRDGSGRPVVTYAGWPLYTYIGDSGPGYPSGQALNTDGGLWYLISSGGTVIRTGG
jgi:predicted lipoprotein with Yx(FWY)xxD motif